MANPSHPLYKIQCKMKQALPAHEEELVFVSFEFSQSRLAIGLRLQNITFSPDALNVQNVSSSYGPDKSAHSAPPSSHRAHHPSRSFARAKRRP